MFLSSSPHGEPFREVFKAKTLELLGSEVIKAPGSAERRRRVWNSRSKGVLGVVLLEEQGGASGL